MKVTSAAFDHEGVIPRKYTCQGEDVTPALSLSEVPEGTKSIAIIVDDPDAPVGTWVHWVAWNIPPDKREIDECEQPGEQGMNDFKRLGYGGPCPPPGPSHTYRFKFYALDTMFELEKGTTKHGLEAAMEGHILAMSELDGEYQRQ
jgi:Raf kinase inhibitor-like YbhB/YbcL family protein